MLKSEFRENLKHVHIRGGVLFSKAKISPNSWTIISLLPAVAGLLFLIQGQLAPALVAFVLSGFIDIIDGNVARVTKSVSNLGAFMDGVIDRYVEFALCLGLWFYLRNTPEILMPTGFWMILLVFGAMMPSFVTAYTDHKNVINDPEKLKNMGGLVERFERLIILYTGMLLGLINTNFLNYAVILAVLLTNLTAIQRIIHVVRNS